MRDSINRLIISGMILSGVVPINNMCGLDAMCKTHTIIPLWVKSCSIRFTSTAIFGTATYSPGRGLIGTYVWLVVRGGTHIDRITHRCKKFAKNQKKVASKENQEIPSGVLKDLVEKARHTPHTGKTSIMTFCGIHDDKQGRGVFNEKGIRYWGVCSGQQKRTYHTRAKA